MVGSHSVSRLLVLCQPNLPSPLPAEKTFKRPMISPNFGETFYQIISRPRHFHIFKASAQRPDSPSFIILWLLKNFVQFCPNKRVTSLTNRLILATHGTLGGSLFLASAKINIFSVSIKSIMISFLFREIARQSNILVIVGGSSSPAAANTSSGAEAILQWTSF